MEYSYKPTTHGLAVMAAYMALEKPFHVTRVAFGSGQVDEDTNLADVHELVEYVSEGAVADRRHQDDRFELTIQYVNKQHPEVKTFLLSEFIVYVEDPETGKETDLIYGTLGDYRQPVPGYNPAYPPSTFNFPLTLILSNEISVDIDAPAGLATWEDLGRVAIRRMDLTIPAEGWVQDRTGKYPFRCDIPVDTATEATLPNLTILEEGEETAAACNLAPRVQTLDGVVRVFASSVPSQSIPASLTLQGDVSGFILSGGGGTVAADIGQGLTRTADGKLAVKIADGLAFDNNGAVAVDGAALSEGAAEVLAEVLSETNENAAKMIDEVYGKG